jgi:hypothetical protein
LLGTFALICAGAVMYFRQAMGLSWVDAPYFVVVTVATVGYGNISLRDQSMPAKLVAMGLILCSTVFIRMIFSLTIASIIRRRVQSFLGRRRYSHRTHVSICDLGRLGYFIAEGLLERGEKVLIVETDESSGKVQHFRSRGRSARSDQLLHPPPQLDEQPEPPLSPEPLAPPLSPRPSRRSGWTIRHSRSCRHRRR